MNDDSTEQSKDAIICKQNICVWMKKRRSQVEPLRSILWRIKNSSKIGETFRGVADGCGQLISLPWNDALSRFPPSILEIFGTKNPFSSLVSALRFLPHETVEVFLSRLKLLSFADCDVSAADVIFLLSAVRIIAAFSFSDNQFNDTDFGAILSALKPLQIRAIDICGDYLDKVLDELDVELLRFCSSPGLNANDFVATVNTSVTVKFIAAQELRFAGDDDAEKFLSVLDRNFPRLRALLWDWNMVDPELVFDIRTKSVVDTLVHLFRKLDLQLLAIVVYTPSAAIYSAAERLIQYLNSFAITNCQLKRFSTKGITAGEPNFTFISAGPDAEMARRAQHVICDMQNPSPDLRHLLYVLDAAFDTHKSNTTFEFCGFNEKAVQNDFQRKYDM